MRPSEKHPASWRLQGTSQLIACQSSDGREAVLLIWTFYTQIFQQKEAASHQQDTGKHPPVTQRCNVVPTRWTSPGPSELVSIQRYLIKMTGSWNINMRKRKKLNFFFPAQNILLNDFSCKRCKLCPLMNFLIFLDQRNTLIRDGGKV